MSLLCGIFPSELKIAKVVPIYKSGDIVKFTKYRPVSVLPVLSRVLERLVYNRLLKFIDKYKILYLYQFGFRQKHSTFIALSSFIDKVTEYTENGEYSIGVFLDFSKTFDTINHEMLFMELHHYGIRGVSLLWFKSYISNRLQYVSYNHCNSTLQKNLWCPSEIHPRTPFISFVHKWSWVCIKGTISMYVCWRYQHARPW